MAPKQADCDGDVDMFCMELAHLIDQRHELAPGGVDRLGSHQPAMESTVHLDDGKAALPTRLMAALLYLKHVYALSDEDVVERWIESPYRQHFSGERYIRHELPCD